MGPYDSFVTACWVSFAGLERFPCGGNNFAEIRLARGASAQCRMSEDRIFSVDPRCEMMVAGEVGISPSLHIR